MIGLFHTQGKIRRFTQHIKNKEKYLGIKIMAKTPFIDPSHLVDYSSPNLYPCPLTVGISFYLLKFRNTIGILHRLAIATFINTLCIN
jgi:hypothetical protein